MAELPKYRPLGVTIQPLPGVDFAAAGRAKAIGQVGSFASGQQALGGAG